MDKIEQLLSDLREEQNLIIGELTLKKDELDKKIKSNLEKKKDLDKREEELAKKEADFAKRSSDVDAKFAKIMTEEQLRVEMEKLNTLVGENQKLYNEAVNKEAEAQLKFEEAQSKELAVFEREKTFEEKIKKQFADKLLK